MIVGIVSDDGTPIVVLAIAGRKWSAVVDTGFNGDFELPEALRAVLPHEHMGRTFSTLAGGQCIEEDAYFVEVPFDGELMAAEATFAPGNQILIGTRHLRKHRLEVNFPERNVIIERV